MNEAMRRCVTANEALRGIFEQETLIQPKRGDYKRNCRYK